LGWYLLLIGLAAFVFIGSLFGFIALGSVRDLKSRVDKLLWSVSQLQRRLDEADDRLRSEVGHAKLQAEASENPGTDSLAELEQLVDEAPAAKAPPLLPASSPVPPLPVPEESLVPEAVPKFEEPPEPVEELLPASEPQDSPSLSVPDAAVPPAPTPLQALLKRIGPKDPNMPWEMALGTYWLPRLGAIALSIAIVFLLTLAIQRWGPPVRVAMGYGVATVLLGIGWSLDRKYSNFARVLFGAGFALLYFVTFATYFVPFAKLFETPTISLSGLCVIVVAWVGLAVRRNSRIIGAIATLLGHLTIGLATFTLSDPTLYSVLGIVVFSFGSAFFLCRMRWYLVAALGMGACYVNNYLLLIASEIRETPSEFILSMTVLAISFLIYAVAERIGSKRIRSIKVPPWARSCFVTANTLGFLALGSVVMNSYGFSAEDHHIFRYALAFVLLVLGMTYLKARDRDPLYNTYLAKSVSIATLGLAVQFEAHTLTAWLAVEMMVLLVAARQSGLLVTRVLAFCVGVIAFVQGIASIQASQFISYSSPGYIVLVAQSLGLIAAYLVASRVYQSVDWSSRSPRTLNVKESTRVVLWKLDLISELPDGRAGETKPFGELLFPHLYAIAAVTLAIYGYIPNLTALGDRAVSLVAGAAILAVAARGLHSASFGLGSIIVAVSAIVPWGIGELINQGITGYGDPIHQPAVIKAISTLVLFLFLSELVRRTDSRLAPQALRLFPAGFIATSSQSGDSDRDDDFKIINLLPYLLAAGALLLFAGWTIQLVAPGHRWVTFSALTLLIALPAIPLGALQFSFVSILASIFATFAGTTELLNEPALTIALPALALLGVNALLSEQRIFGAREGLGIHQWEKSPYFLYGSVAWLLGLYFVRVYPPSAEVLVLLLSAVGAAILALILHREALAICSLFLLLWSQAMWHLGFTYDDITSFRPLAWGILAALIASDRYFTALKVSRVLPMHMIAAWLLLLSYVFLEIPADWIAIWWSISAAAFFGYGVICRTRAPVLLALLTTAFASLFQTVHALEDMMPVGAVIVGFAGPILMWLVFERSVSFLQNRYEFVLSRRPSALFVGIASGLAALMLFKIPSLSEYYLTISWSVLGLILFGLALAFREKMYRYAGLIVLLLASIRVVAVDTRELETLPKVFAWGVLGAVLIALGYGYVRAVASRGEKRVLSVQASAKDA
jgi:hypothetical protein